LRGRAEGKGAAWIDLTKSLYEGKDRGYEAPILLDSDNLIAEGPGYNVFVIKNRKLSTPARNALPGITRKTVADIGRSLGYEVVEADVTVEELTTADEVFTATTAGALVPVISIDGQPVGDGAPGPITKQLLERYWAAMDEPSDWIQPVTYR
jgi:branched-chain amino acid aminotransferase